MGVFSQSLHQSRGSAERVAAAGHIPLNRMDRKSQVQCLGDCRTMLAKGASVLFFPEGTRSLDARLGSFKKGAFSVAAKAKVGSSQSCS